jgi:hypothetical protein
MNDISQVSAACNKAALEGAGAQNTVTSAIGSSFLNGNVSVRSHEYTRDDYTYWRPSERIPAPSDHREVVRACNDVYDNIGIVRNIVDLMSDFAVKGFDWTHTNRSVEIFYKNWFKYIGGKDFIERFCVSILRDGAAAVYRETQKISPEVAREWKRARSAEFMNVNSTKLKLPKSYTLISPMFLHDHDPVSNTFAKKPVLRIQPPRGPLIMGNNNQLVNSLRSPNNQSFRAYRSIPEGLRKKQIVQDGADIDIYHYRKNDWDLWSLPVIYSILEPLIMLQKMHLCDTSALDGAISSVRLWRAGYIDQNNALNSIIPSPEVLKKIQSIVLNNIHGGVLDIFWGPDLDFKESSTNVHDFLKPEKYTHVMNMIYDGMGIPPALIGGGASSQTTGFTNNFISMKIFVERLNYIRMKLKEFLMRESKIVQLAMGFSSPAAPVFEDAIVSDENNYHSVLIELYDRDIISLETMREEFNKLNHIEQSRVRKEYRRRDKELLPPKTGRYYQAIDQNPEPVDSSSPVNPKEKEEAPTDKGGRPNNSNDIQKRKPKVVSPRSAAEMLQIQSWAKEALDKIGTIVSPAYLNSKNKSTARQLTSEESQELEDIKLGVLMNIKAHSNFDAVCVSNALKNIGDFSKAKTLRDNLLKEVPEKFNREINKEDVRISAAAAYAMTKMTQN